MRQHRCCRTSASATAFATIACCAGLPRMRGQLPWRPSPGLYETWISEIMLQQTQVATVVPYYTRFLQRFPDVADVGGRRRTGSAALLGRIGLLSPRAATARRGAADRAEHGTGSSRPPSTSWRTLPGIGRYTAGAILSIALDQRHPILEANTVRVLSRLLGARRRPDCAATASAACGRLPSARAAPAVRRLQSGADGVGQHDVHAPRAAMCRMSCRGRSVRTRHAGCKMQIPRPRARLIYGMCTKRRWSCVVPTVACCCDVAGGRALGGVVGFPAF